MNTPKKEKKTPVILSVLQNKCPRCREGKMFKDSNPYHLKHALDMHEHCPSCGQNLEPEVGFYYGTGFVSYGLSFAISVAAFIAWIIFIGVSYKDNRVFYFLGFDIALLLVLQPVLMRLSRSIYIAFFVRYEPAWKLLSQKTIRKPITMGNLEQQPGNAELV